MSLRSWMGWVGFYCWVFTVSIYTYYALIIWLPPPITLPDGP